MDTTLPLSDAERTNGPTVRALLASAAHLSLARRFGAVIAVFFAVGALAAGLMRLELLSPAGWMVGSDTFDKLFSLHGMMMVYFVLLPAFPAIVGLALLPAALRAPEFAFPRLNLAAWRLFSAGGGLALLAAMVGGADAGWTFAAPYSLLSAQGAISLAATGVFLAALAYVLLSVNILATVHAWRGAGTSWSELPMLAIGLSAGSLTMLIAAPVLAMAMILLLASRFLPLHLFDAGMGGDPALFNHIFWFGATPAVYAILLPAAGVVSELLPHYARRPLAARRWVAGALLAVAGLSFFLWTQHMMTGNAPLYRRAFGTLLSHLMALPMGLVLVSWIVTSVRGARAESGPHRFLLVSMLLLLVGLLTGLCLASPALHPHLHNTVFVVAHLHLLLAGGMLAALLAGVAHAWPALAGREAPAAPLRTAANLILAGVPATFGPLFVLGYLGLPRRHHLYPAEFQVLQVLASAGATILIAGFLVAGFALLASLRRRAREA